MEKIEEWIKHLCLRPINSSGSEKINERIVNHNQFIQNIGCLEMEIERKKNEIIKLEKNYQKLALDFQRDINNFWSKDEIEDAKRKAKKY